MFLYNVAFSLEFISIGIGAFLISWAIHKSECAPDHLSREEARPVNVGTADVSRTSYHSRKACYGAGFAKAIGIIIIILAVLNMIDTLYCTVKYRHFIHRVHDRVENRMNKNSDTSNYNSNSNSSSPATTGNSGKDNSTQNSGY